MKRLNIKARHKRRFKVTTDSQHALAIADNILDRKFTAIEPDQAWVADITYIETHQGWLYLAVVIDMFSRQVVGWSMAEHMRTDLVLTALEAALGKRIPAQSGLVFHSDRGCQYASSDYRTALERAGITCSMSGKGNCWDNAVAEAFLALSKLNLFTPEYLQLERALKPPLMNGLKLFTIEKDYILQLVTFLLYNTGRITGQINTH